ncbi:MAG: hypothetical protein CVU89_05545 [Firmicutes bacterium HGW-Firmicutes-14]|nr:MAG: hypothetical protein CVU89_05545 [Firmicutes bacterium HGW-Firmicutes-14]
MTAKKKRVNSNNNSTNNNSANNILTNNLLSDNLRIIFFLVLPLLLIPPFRRGLFFDFEADIAHIYTALVFGAYIFMRRDRIRLSRNIMDYAWIGLIIAYIISNFVAFNQRAALEQALRVFNFFVVYWLLAQTIRGMKDIKTTLSVIFAAGVGVALAGLGTAYGTFWFNGAYDKGLILSTLQYHNAAAIFLVACGIVGFYLTGILDNLWLRILSGGLNYIIIATAYGAGSRGAMLVTPIGLIFLFAGLPKQVRLKVFLNFTAVLIPFVLTAKQVLSFGVHSEAYYWGWLIAGTVLGFACQFAVEKFLAIGEETRKRIVTVGGIVITIVAVGLILFLGQKVMPESIADRVSSISLKDISVLERFYFYRDAFELVKDYPVLGAGGGGWNSAYTRYQSYLYFTTEVHSHPLQVWVETGTAGFVFYMLIWIGLIITVYKIMRRVESPEYRAAAWTSAVAAVTISIHSVIDFSLSLGAVAILMWALAGLVRGIEQLSLPEQAEGRAAAGPMVRKIAGALIALVFFVISASLTIASFKEKEAYFAYNSGNYQGAVDLFEEARKYDPVKYEYPMYLASFYSNMAYERQNYMFNRTAVVNAEEAVNLNEMAVQPLWTLVETYMAARRPLDAAKAAEEALRAAPWRQDSYENLARVYLTCADMLKQESKNEQAAQIMQKVLGIPGLIEEQVGKLGPDEKKLWRHGPMPGVSEKIKKAIEQAELTLK